MPIDIFLHLTYFLESKKQPSHVLSTSRRHILNFNFTFLIPQHLKLSKKFYQSNDVVQISKDLLGKVLVTNFNNQLTSGIIVETEAYRAPDDKACHAYKNRKTERTKTMFEAGGIAYIYLCYGIHHLFNIVTSTEGNAHAVLIRAIEPIENVELMLKRRNFSTSKPQLTAGPGVLTKALGITTSNNGLDIMKKNSPIWVEDRGVEVPKNTMIASPRVGVGYAEECATWPWRFRIKNNRWTSNAK